MRRLTDILEERNQEAKIKEERKQYKKLKLETPITHWNSYEKFQYYMEFKKKRHKSLFEEKDQRSKIAALGAIKRAKMEGPEWIEFVDWLDQNNKLGMIWHAIKEIDQFRKERKKNGTSI